MKNETANKVAFLMLAIVVVFLISWVISSADCFCTAVLALIVGVFCWDIEKNFEILKKEGHPKNFEPIKEYLGIVTQGKVEAYVINLDEAKKRWDFMKPQVEALQMPYERVAAVEGKKLSKKFMNEIVDETSYMKFFRGTPELGTIGCSLSHERVWRKFLESDNEFALILEDDVKFDPMKLREIVNFSIENEGLWDILSFESNHHGYPQKIAKFSSKKIDESEFLVFYMTNVKHSGAYLIGRSSAKKMLEKFYPIKMPLDHYYSRSWEFGLRFCGIEPRIVEQKFGDSQIKLEASKKIEDKRILITNIAYNVYTECMRTTYNALLYLASRRRL